MDSPPPLLAAIEAGGTKYVCAVAFDPREPIAETRFPTGAPAETLARAAEFFREAAATHGPIASMGIGTFGPAAIDPASPEFGCILTTPKEGWAGFGVVAAIREHLGDGFPIAFENDVNVAALAEATHGVGRGKRHLAYITIGTGIGGGFLSDGTLLHGRMHPEIGHLVVPDLDAAFGKAVNVCPFHESCLEGRASGPAIEARWGLPGHELPDRHPAWELEAKYLALGCLNLTAAWSPDLIILGGGVSQKAGLIEGVRREFTVLTGNYWSLPAPEDYLRLPELDQQAGIVGALLLARRRLTPNAPVTPTG
ncbi:MAG: ROK family protein [Verrucomicrobiaceae bacterium]|nr:ROK family protein [Verrucomicrobiaceae bacterium]